MGLKALFDGLGQGSADELSQPDLLRKITEEFAKLARHDDKGIPLLPREVEVHIKVGEGSVQVIERFVQDAAFDRELEARLLNELVRLQPEALPLRKYIVEAAETTSVEVRELKPRKFRLRIEGGDREGARLPLPQGRRDFLLGRGEWHGDDPGSVNDVVLSETEKAVSRRAARLHRSSHGLELESLDQKEALVVVRPDGERVRPVLSANGRVLVGPEDVIEFTDGKQSVLRVRLEEE
jgi:hypothetical protein